MKSVATVLLHVTRIADAYGCADCRNIRLMEFDWDAANIGHVAVHDVTPDGAEEAVLKAAIALDVRLRNGEERTRLV